MVQAITQVTLLAGRVLRGKGPLLELHSLYTSISSTASAEQRPHWKKYISHETRWNLSFCSALLPVQNLGSWEKAQHNPIYGTDCDNSHGSEFYLPRNLWQNICSSSLADADRSLDIITDREAARSEGVPSAGCRDAFASQSLVNTGINDLEEKLKSLLIKNADDSDWESGT